MPESCQVDFYLLASAKLDERRMACRLALMAWERGHRAVVVTESDSEAAQMDELMWESPADRFVPHERDGGGGRGPAPVIIMPMTRLREVGLNARDVVINLSAQPVAEPAQFARLLEIVPFQNEARQSSREKFRHYRDLGISPGTHKINK